ncbi:ArsR/SmtB family transcription factor [Actinoallomurus iriomotensis]|uniref:Transcriptional regulator n=1 Tax=Actinoallomurus iriomotensis TaxID=478107 RepID=A0A9W6VYB4_9ACTN|nr:helix-turn-helix domain-containing protein [Actinoallomurus iriomotensis]GLY89888.1 transcriptional regulator [Actinoallomurus iriomotensis]
MPEPQEINDLEVLKALAHPRRQKMLEHLALHGPATSASLARALDLNTGATSYHLRELARHGFVEELADRAHGRERWWRAVPGDRRFPPPSRQSPQVRAALDQLNRMAFDADVEAFGRFLGRRGFLGEWGDAVPYSRSLLHLTLDEVREFFEEYIRLVNRFKRDPGDVPEDARPVYARFLAFPATADEPATDSDLQ